MNQVVCIVYRPGAFGSFVAWCVERFSAVRKVHGSVVTDDPLLPDGSSHAYASFCKIKSTDDFMQGFDAARWDTMPWHSAVFAGWPGGDINQSVAEISAHMTAFDKLIVIQCEDADDHYLCYLRNESTMDRSRWYGMLGISDDSDIYAALERDINAPMMDRDIPINDPRVCVFGIRELLESTAQDMFESLSKVLAWPMCDHDLFRSVYTDMQRRQQPYIDKVRDIKLGNAITATEMAISRHFREKEKTIWT